MLIFVYEYTCASLCDPDLPASLRREGQAMLSAVLDDLEKIDGVETTTLLAADFPSTLSHHCHRRQGDERDQFQKLACQADFTLVIAPEFDDLLRTRCQWVGEAGGRSLNAQDDAIELAADKWALAQHFSKHEIPTPKTELLASVDPDRQEFPCVCKPRFGAGSMVTAVVNNEAEVQRWETTARREGCLGDGIIQPWIRGRPASVALLIEGTNRISLWPCAQHISDDGRCRYLGGRVPLERSLCQRAVTLATSAVSCIGGLRGYIGVDLILGEAADGRDDYVIEINPRLTTSYIGLRHLSPVNLAELMLKLADREKVDDDLDWLDVCQNAPAVEFSPNGDIQARPKPR